MIIPASAATAALYKKIAKPLLFKRKPDDVHAHLLKTGAAVQRIGILRGMVHASWAYTNKPALSQTVNGITFENPVGLSAGFDKNFELVPLMKAVGFGLMEGGSITYHRCDGNPRPWFYRLPKSQSLVVHVGLANHGTRAIIKRLQRYPVQTLANFPLNISVAKTNSPGACDEKDAIADYIGSLRLLEKADMGDMYTLNISCPNTYGGEPFTTPARLENLLRATDALGLHKPLFIKMPIHLPWPEFEQLVIVADRHKVAGLTISNLAKNRDNAKLKDPLPDTVAGNLSGKPTQELSDQLIRQTYQTFPGRFTIIGVGGIFTAKDAYRKITYGANLVELITGMIFEGPQLAGRINRDLVTLLERDGYKNISEAVGSAVTLSPRKKRVK